MLAHRDNRAMGEGGDVSGRYSEFEDSVRTELGAVESDGKVKEDEETVGVIEPEIGRDRKQ